MRDPGRPRYGRRDGFRRLQRHCDVVGSVRLVVYAVAVGGADDDGDDDVVDGVGGVGKRLEAPPAAGGPAAVAPAAGAQCEVRLRRRQHQLQRLQLAHYRQRRRGASHRPAEPTAAQEARRGRPQQRPPSRVWTRTRNHLPHLNSRYIDKQKNKCMSARVDNR